MNDLSYLMILSLISVNIPGIAQSIQASLLGFIYLDILQTERWISSLVPESSNLLDISSDYMSPLSTQFQLSGFSTKVVLLNLGSTAFFILAFLGAHFLAALLSVMADYCQR
jgi:hypothetical protein